MPTLCLVEVTQLRTKVVDGRRALFSKKQTNNKVKNITFHPLAPTCVSRFPPILHGDRGGLGHHFRSYTFLGPIHSFAARGRRKFGWKRPHRSKLLIILSFIEIKQPNLVELCRLVKRINCVNFYKNRARDPPLRGNYIGKIPIFFSFWGRKPPPLNRSRWNLARRSGPMIGATCRPCGAKNPKIGLWVKTIPAELPAADPAGNKT